MIWKICTAIYVSGMESFLEYRFGSHLLIDQIGYQIFCYDEMTKKRWMQRKRMRNLTARLMIRLSPQLRSTKYKSGLQRSKHQDPKGNLPCLQGLRCLPSHLSWFLLRLQLQPRSLRTLPLVQSGWLNQSSFWDTIGHQHHQQYLL